MQPGYPIARLPADSHVAQLLVLGNRGLGGVSGLPVGSVAAALATHTACPVVVVHGRTPDAPAPGRRASGGRCGRVNGQ